MTMLQHATAVAIAAAIRAGELTAEAAMAACFDRIAAVDPPLRAFVANCPQRAQAAAAALDARLRRGEPVGTLAGVPIGYKDNLVCAGELATAGSRMLANFRSPYTASVLARLEAADGLLIGRTNMDEFGMGSSTETSVHGATRNPFGRDLVPGGSSGGSAVAVAADLCPLAIGSDTGGSVRQPAALCGVTGFKPTYGRVSRNGLIAYASSLDCVGAIARTATDLALWLDAVAGPDPADPTTIPPAPPVLPQLGARGDLRGVRCGVPWELNGPGIDDEVLAATHAAIQHLRDLGAELVECSLPSATLAVPAYYLLATTEAASNLARYDGVQYGLRRDGGNTSIAATTQTRSAGFGAEVQLRILLGTFASSYGYADQFYGRAGAAREALRQDFARLFADCDVLLAPTSPTAAFAFDASPDDPLTRYLQDALTVPASLAGLPALSMPCGFTADGRPIGLQLMAAPGRDALVLQCAHVFQQHSEHHLARPIA